MSGPMNANAYPWFYRHFTPWARAALRGAGITARDIELAQPAGWLMTGSGRSSGGPFTFRLREQGTGRELVAMAQTHADVRAAVERLTGENALLEQLRASVEALG